MSDFQALANHLNSQPFFKGGYTGFSSLEDAIKALDELDGDIKALKYALNERMFDDAYTENAMIKELSRLEDDADELACLILQIQTNSLVF